MIMESAIASDYEKSSKKEVRMIGMKQSVESKNVHSKSLETLIDGMSYVVLESFLTSPILNYSANIQCNELPVTFFNLSSKIILLLKSKIKRSSRFSNHSSIVNKTFIYNNIFKIKAEYNT